MINHFEQWLSSVGITVGLCSDSDLNCCEGVAMHAVRLSEGCVLRWQTAFMYHLPAFNHEPEIYILNIC
jgi:hypothetical protein